MFPAIDERDSRPFQSTMVRRLARRHHTQERSDLSWVNLWTTAATVNGAPLTQARRDKKAKCAELARNERCQLVVVEGGAQKPLEFVADMASSRARDTPPVLRRSSFLAWWKRWTRMLSIAPGRSRLPWSWVQRDAWAGRWWVGALISPDVDHSFQQPQTSFHFVSRKKLIRSCLLQDGKRRWST